MTDENLVNNEVSGDKKLDIDSNSKISSRILATVFENLVLIPLKDREDKKLIENFLLAILLDAHHPLIGKLIVIYTLDHF